MKHNVNTEYDFFSMGIRCGQEKLNDLVRVANEIEMKYGIDAKLQFESGIAITIPTYSEVQIQKPTMKDIENSSSDYGHPRLSNNSYLGGNGVRSR